MEGFIQILSLLPIPLVAGMLCFVILASFGILIAALTNQKICNRLVRLIKGQKESSPPDGETPDFVIGCLQE